MKPLENGETLPSPSSAAEALSDQANGTQRRIQGSSADTYRRNTESCNTYITTPSVTEAALLAADTARLLSEKFPSIDPSIINSAVYASVLKSFEKKEVPPTEAEPPVSTFSSEEPPSESVAEADEAITDPSDVPASQATTAAETSQIQSFHQSQFDSDNPAKDENTLEQLINSLDASTYDYEVLAQWYYNSMMNFPDRE